MCRDRDPGESDYLSLHHESVIALAQVWLSCQLPHPAAFGAVAGAMPTDN